MDANLQDKTHHGNIQLCTKAVIWGLFEVISPGIVRYQSLYREKINIIISDTANFVTKPEHECHWLPGITFNQTLDEDRISHRLAIQKLFDLQIPHESETNPALLELSISLVQLWTENLADLCDRNKFIASETVLKHPSITALKYDGLDALQKLLTEGLCKKNMKDHFQKQLHENQWSVDGLIDLKMSQFIRLDPPSLSSNCDRCRKKLSR